MTGPEHYEAAEHCLESVADDSQEAIALLAEAQVHATLALAAATVDAATDGLCNGPGWARVAS